MDRMSQQTCFHGEGMKRYGLDWETFETKHGPDHTESNRAAGGCLLG